MKNYVVESDGTYTVNGVEVLEVGTWQLNDDGESITITQEQIDLAATHTNANLDLIKPMIKIGHGKQNLLSETGQPAFGWLENFRAVGGKLVADAKKVSKYVIEAAEKGLFRRVSAEVSFSWLNPTTNEQIPIVVRALSLLGASPPVIKTLADFLHLSEAAREQEEGVAFLLREQERKANFIMELEEKKEMENQNQNTQSTNEAALAELDRVKIDAVTGYVRLAQEQNKITPAEANDAIEFAKRLQFSEAVDYSKSFLNRKPIQESTVGSKSGSGDPNSKNEKTVPTSQKVVELAKARAKEMKISFAEAFREVCDENPDLENDWHAQTFRRIRQGEEV